MGARRQCAYDLAGMMSCAADDRALCHNALPRGVSGWPQRLAGPVAVMTAVSGHSLRRRGRLLRPSKRRIQISFIWRSSWPALRGRLSPSAAHRLPRAGEPALPLGSYSFKEICPSTATPISPYCQHTPSLGEPQGGLQSRCLHIPRMLSARSMGS